MPRLASVLCLVASLSVMSSCSSFDWRWDSTAAPVAANPAALADGKWEGDWQSDAVDYHGHVQAIILHTTQSTANGKLVQQYAASFRFRWMEFGYSEFNTTLNATVLDDGRVHFEGKKDLGYFFGGIIRLDGLVYPNKDKLYCDYSTDKDSGTYKMRRVLQDGQ